MEIRPADWDSFAQVMGEKGGCGGCWCMLWRSTRKDFDANKGDGNRAAMARVFAAERPPGLVGILEGQAVGWIQIAERSAFPALERSRILKPVDAVPVWSVAWIIRSMI